MTWPAHAAAPVDKVAAFETRYLRGERLVNRARTLLGMVDVVAIDFETSIGPPHRRIPYVLSMHSDGGDTLLGFLDQPSLLRQIFRPLLDLHPWERPTLVAHNAQFEVEVLLRDGVEVPLDVECTLLAAKCLYLTAVPEGVPQPVEFSLAALVEREFGRRRDKSTRDRDWSTPDALDDEGIRYCLDDARDALDLWALYHSRLKEQGLLRGYRVVQRAVLPTAAINHAGMHFDAEAHGALCSDLGQTTQRLEADLDRRCNRAVLNHGSSRQVADWIVEEVLGVRHVRPPEKPRFETLADFVRKTGGVRADGETKARDLPKRIAHKDGRPHEAAALAAWEDGFFPGHRERPPADALLDALAEDLRKGTPSVLREDDQAERDRYQEALAVHEATREDLLERGLDGHAKLLAAFDMRLRAKTGAGWRWTDTGHLRIDKGAMARKPAQLREYWPAVARYLEARAEWVRANKLLTAFGPTLREKVGDDGRVRGQLRVGGTVTMRHSCADPNLQQIPADPTFRAVFKAPPGRKLVVADFSQIELRLLAVVSQDERLLEVYRLGKDVHDETQKVTKVPTRRLAKNINFGVAYGSGAAGLAENIGIPLDEAQLFLARFLAAYPGVARYRDTAMAEGMRHGQIDIRPERRVLLDPKIDVPATVAINYPIQGGAASVQMRALRKIHDALDERPDLNAFLVAAVHDEFALETSTDRAAEAGEVLQTCMRGALVELYPEAIDQGAANLAEASVVDTWADKA